MKRKNILQSFAELSASSKQAFDIIKKRGIFSYTGNVWSEERETN